MVKKKSQYQIILCWLLLYPLALWLGFALTDFPNTVHFLDLSIFVILTIIVSMFPLKIVDTNISLLQGISIAVFLYFGLFTAQIMIQLSIICVLIVVKVPFKEYFRYLAMTLMFAWISLFAGLVYDALGGETGPYQHEHFAWIAIVAYFITYFALNHILLYFVRVFLYKEQSVDLVDKDTWWDLVSECLVIPGGLLLYMLYSQMGIPGIFYVSIPFVAITIIIKMYHSSQQINYWLKQASEIGQRMTKHLRVNDILDVFIESLGSRLPVDVAYIVDSESGEYFHPLRLYEKTEGMIVKGKRLRKDEGLSGIVWLTRKSIMFDRKSRWQSLSDQYFSGKAESVISVPMMHNHIVVGIITFVSKKKRAYEKHHLLILEILSNYLTVAIANAKNYELTKRKSEQCQLTGLYNYRFFENVLTEMYAEYEYKHQDFSIILLDIDHFKRVNDTYGHQSGNEILIQLAQLLRKLVDTNGTVARYGGEEFIILLPMTNMLKSYKFAEEIRMCIAETPFTINNDLTDKKEVTIHITASIGVATAPHQGEDPMELIRNADRAMYTGAKKAGRNKVAVYS